MLRLIMLGLLLTACSSNPKYITISPDTALFCLPPPDYPLEYECTWIIDEETGERRQRVCPRGYIHRVDRPNTCRKKDVPIEKVK
jgi:hypothetical protein